jgi:RNA polymerase sigma-70 factor (sigma-E family)
VPGVFTGEGRDPVNDPAATQFREYVAARQAALFRSAVLLTGHRQDAEDLLQAALTKLAQRWPTISKSGSPDAYVRRTMYHQRISWWRRRRHGQEFLSDALPDVGGPGDVAADSTLRLALAQVLGQLTAKQRAVVILRYYEDLPEAEVADILGISVGTVRSQTHRTLARLRELCPDLVPMKELISNERDN